MNFDNLIETWSPPPSYEWNEYFKKITLHLALRDPNLYWQVLVCANSNFISWKTFYISCTQIYHQSIKMELKYLLKKITSTEF